MVGVSVEDAEPAGRIAALRTCGARRTFVSFEPLVGSFLDGYGEIDLTGVDYAIVGGESDKHTRGEANARPMEPAWAREIRDASLDQGVAFHFKQWGAWGSEGQLVGTKRSGRELDGRTHDDEPEWYRAFMRRASLIAAATRVSRSWSSYTRCSGTRFPRRRPLGWSRRPATGVLLSPRVRDSLIGQSA